MVTIMSLWLPIILSAIVVFLASAVLHMVLPFHRSDYKRLPKEDGVMDALRPFDIPPGDYVAPCAGGPKEMKDPKFIEKMTRGPVLIVTVLRAGPPAMGASLAQWFVFCVIVSVFAAYVAGRALAPGATYLQVFRFAGAVSFVGYALAQWQNSIWYKRAWTTTVKTNVDGLLYGLLTAGLFGWLWPR